MTQVTVGYLFAGGALLVMVLGYNLPRARTILFAIAFFTLTSAAFTNYSNWLPQVRGEVPEVFEIDPADMANWSIDQLAEFGEKIIFGKVVGGNPNDGDVGKGQCPLCHSVTGSVKRDRGPNLKGGNAEPGVAPPIGERGPMRIADPAFTNPNNAQTESNPGKGRATNSIEYIAESHACPSCYVVPGYGEMGTNDTKSPMPKIHKKPIELSIEELIAVDTYLYVKDNLDPPSFDEIRTAYEKFIPKSEIVSFAPPKEGGGDPCETIACPTDEPVDIIAKMGCPVCHKIPTVDFANVGILGPLLMEGHNAPNRIKSAEYIAAINAGTASAMTPKGYVIESIMNPSAFIVPGFPTAKAEDFPGGKSLMPHNFPEKFTYAAVSNLADFLLSLDKQMAIESGYDRSPFEKEFQKDGSLLKQASAGSQG